MNNLDATCPKCRFKYKIPLNQQLVRTLPQNSLYWGVYIKTISEELGYMPEELHEELKLMFNPKDSRIKLGDRYGGSTKTMKRKEFGEYLDKIRIWAQQEYNINLPEQGE